MRTVRLAAEEHMACQFNPHNIPNGLGKGLDGGLIEALIEV